MARAKRMAECHPDRPNNRHGLCHNCGQRAYRLANREKVAAWAKVSRARLLERDPDYDRRQHAARREQSAIQVRRYQMLTWYGLTIEEYDVRLEAQGGVCAICLRPERAPYREKVRRLAVDHDHATGQVRGLLCASCNSAIGQFEDDPEVLRRAIAYLEGVRRG